MKPWVTNVIKKSMMKRDKLYREMVKAKNNHVKIQKDKSYKSYRNKIVDLLKTSKRNHHKKYFEENKKNCKVVWNGTHEIV